MRTSIIFIIPVLFFFTSLQGQSIRKPWREMTTAEQTAYVNAINSLPTSVVQTLANEHDRLAMLFGNNNHIHNSNIFLPWHRVYLQYFEDQLKAINPEVTIPYWDWTDDWATNSQLFRDASGGSTGLFGLNVSGSVWINPATGVKYTRGFTTETQPTQTLINNIVSQTNFSTHRSNLEIGPHNTGHRRIGGTMASMVSPADPIFYLHHSMVDKVWNDWVEQHWNGGTLAFSDDADPQLNMLTFIGYAGSTAPSNVVRVNPNDWIDGRNSKVWYADGGQVSLNSYNVTGTENYRYTGTINMENSFAVQTGTTCNVLAGTSVFLKPGFTAAAGSAFRAFTDMNEFNSRLASERPMAGTNMDKVHTALLEASIEASRDIVITADIDIYGIQKIAEETASNNLITAYPNPSSGNFVVSLNNSERSAEIRIVDLLGKVTDAKIDRLTDNQYKVEFLNPVSGYYVINITTASGKVRNEKIVVK